MRGHLGNAGRRVVQTPSRARGQMRTPNDSSGRARRRVSNGWCRVARSTADWRSGRREGYPSRPPTPPCVRFRTRRFKCSAADPGVESEGSGVPTPQASDCSRPHACARPPRSTRRSPGGGGLTRTRSLESFQGCSQVLSPQHLLQQRLGLWSDRVRVRRCRLTHESRLMATSGRLLPGSLGRLSSHDCGSVGTRDHGIGPGSLVRASGRCDDPSALSD